MESKYQNDLFWIDKGKDGFCQLHFKDGTTISVETEQLATKIAMEVLYNNGTVGK